jgi:prepilin-type N-terminal cleavage/methylation domain-containing protein
MAKHKTQTDGQQGFTLIELMIATTIFSVILLAAAATMVQIGRLYYKGVITSKTQGVARTVTDDISRSIQFSDGAKLEFPPGEGAQPPVNIRCFGSTRFTYVLGARVNSKLDNGQYIENPRQILHGLWQDEIPTGGCNSEVPKLTLADPYSGYPVKDRKGRELLENDMRLQTLDISSPPGASDVHNITVKVVYGEDSLFDSATNPTRCVSSVIGGSWCAVSEISTTVYGRVK